MELEEGEAADVRGLRHVIERRIHEHAGELDAPVELRPDRLGLLQSAHARAARPEDHPERPGAEVRRQVGVLEGRYSADLDAGHRPPIVAGAPLGQQPAAVAAALIRRGLIG